MASTLRPRDGRLWTSAEAARAFRVGVSSVKRWTDEAELESVRTPGGHRRYTLKALHRFAAARRLPTDLLPPLESDIHVPKPPDITLFEALVRGDADAVRCLVTPAPDGLAKRATFLDRVIGDAMREIGDRWERGEIDVAAEHRASGIVLRIVGRLGPRFVRRGRSRGTVVLGAPPGERHGLPVALLADLLRGSGWEIHDLGADVPAADFARIASLNMTSGRALRTSSTLCGANASIAARVESITS